MCGRYAASSSTDELVEEFLVDVDATGRASRSILVAPQQPPAGAPDFNLAPSKQARVVLGREGKGESAGQWQRQLHLLTWGLIPPWSKSARTGRSMFNARVEGVESSRAFAPSLASRRCLVPADGWYEWRKLAGGEQLEGDQSTPAASKPAKQPFFIHAREHKQLAFAGLYTWWRDRELPEEDPLAWVGSFTIITTSAQGELAEIHDRQPLVLLPEDQAAWLAPGPPEPELLTPTPEDFFAWHPVGAAVGNSRATGPGLSAPLP